MTLLVLVLALSGVMTVEKGADKHPNAVRVQSEMIVDAPPERVWPSVIEIPRLSPPSDPVLKTGVAYPVEAEIDGHGEDAVRYCRFTTGSFVEPIEVWDPPRRLAFSVRSSPPTMKELTPYGTIETPHVDGFFESTRGRFDLTRLSGGRTRLTGVTRYKNKMWPAAYWKLWSDFIIHRIHLRVLREMKQEVENTPDRK